MDALGAPDASGTVYLPSWGSLQLTWDGFGDAESGLEGYEVGLGSGDCGSDDVVAMHAVGRRKVRKTPSWPRSWANSSLFTAVFP